MTNLNEWFRQHRGLAYSGLGLLMAVLFVSIANVCQLEDIVRFDTPADVQEAIKVEASVPMSQADMVWEEWQAYVKRNTDRLQLEIVNGRERAAMLLSFVDMGVQAASGPLSTLPGGAFLVGGLSLLTGLFLKRPGDKKREQAAIDKAVQEASQP